MDVISLNYQGVGVRTLPSDFPAFRKQFPDKVIFSSESASTLSSRGEYLFPVSGSTSGPVRPGVGGDPRTRHVSAYELHAADFRIVATSNGDPTSFVPFQSLERRAFNGFALAIVRGVSGRPGAIVVRAESASLRGDAVPVNSVRVGPRQRIPPP